MLASNLKLSKLYIPFSKICFLRVHVSPCFFHHLNYKSHIQQSAVHTSAHYSCHINLSAQQPLQQQLAGQHQHMHCAFLTLKFQEETQKATKGFMLFFFIIIIAVVIVFKPCCCRSGNGYSYPFPQQPLKKKVKLGGDLNLYHTC